MTDVADDRSQDVARAAADWSWETDERLHITRLCSRFAGSTGRAPVSLLGRPVVDIGPLPEDVLAALDRREPFRAQPFVLDDAGSFDLSGAPAFDTTGAFQGYRGTAARHDAKADDGAHSVFLSSISHEFRTPLNAIIGFAEAMDGAIHGPLSDRYAGYARDIAQAGHHLLALVEDILDASALEHGTTHLETSEVDVDGLLDKTIRIASVSAAARALTLERKDTPEGLKVWADPGRACQVLVNLLSNAIKFTPSGGAIVLTAKRKGERVAISVTDTGPGIAPENQERIFEKFERLDDLPFPRREGAGLGLSIARDLARLMGGKLKVKSVPGEGARFTLLLPAA